MRIGENLLIWVSHSPTIIEFKELFSASFKDIILMLYGIYNDSTLLHQRNIDTNKVYRNNWPINLRLDSIFTAQTLYITYFLPENK